MFLLALVAVNAAALRSNGNVTLVPFFSSLSFVFLSNSLTLTHARYCSGIGPSLLEVKAKAAPFSPDSLFSASSDAAKSLFWNCPGAKNSGMSFLFFIHCSLCSF